MNLEKFDMVIVGIVWVVSSFTHALTKLQTVRLDPVATAKYTLLDFTIMIVIAGFSGLIFFLTASLFFTSAVPLALFTGVGGFLGPEGLKRITGVLQEVLISVITRK